MQDSWEERIWKEQVCALATFNLEKARGIVHTSKYEEHMRRIQLYYDSKWEDELGRTSQTTHEAAISLKKAIGYDVFISWVMRKTRNIMETLTDFANRWRASCRK